MFSPIRLYRLPGSDRAWLDTPEPAELNRMNDYTSDVDLAMHVCHQQLYWEKRNQNEQDGISWTRSEYVEYVGEQIEKIPVVTKFLESFRSTAPGPARPMRTVVTPNDQERGPPETAEDKKVNALRDEISKRFKKHLNKAKNNEATSASESEAPKRKIQSNLCQRNRKMPLLRLVLIKHPAPMTPPQELIRNRDLLMVAVGKLLRQWPAVR